MTEQQKAHRAAVSRENGAKSHGPVTPAGKKISSLNSITTGEHLNLLKDDLPPFLAILSTDSMFAYLGLLTKHVRQYQPHSACEHNVLRHMAVEMFHLERTINLENFARQSGLDETLRKYPDLNDRERELQNYKQGLQDEKLWRSFQRDKKFHQSAYLQHQRAFRATRKDFPLIPPEPVSMAVDINQLQCPMPDPEVIAEILEHVAEKKADADYPLPRWVAEMLVDGRLMTAIVPDFDWTGLPETLCPPPGG